MFEFLLRYPIGYYAKALFKPGKKGNPYAVYFSQDEAMILIESQAGRRLYFNPSIKGLTGAPTYASLTRRDTPPNNPFIPSNYRKEVISPFGLTKGNEITILLDHPNTFFGLQSANKNETVAALKEKLEKDPEEIVSIWQSSYTGQGEYLWEILDTQLATVPDNESVPNFHFLVGLPKETVDACTRFAEAHNNELVNLYPTPYLVLRWCLEQVKTSHIFKQQAALPKETQEGEEDDDFGQNEGPPPNTFFVIYEGKTCQFISLFLDGKCSIFSMTKERVVQYEDLVEEINQSAEEEGLPRDTLIQTWGITEGNPMIDYLNQGGWENIVSIDQKFLATQYPIKPEKPVPAPVLAGNEIWLMDYAIS